MKTENTVFKLYHDIIQRFNAKFLFVLLLCSLATNAFSQNYYVSPSGSDSNDGLSIDKPLKSINKGVEKVQPGGTVFIMNGTYNRTTWGSPLNINKSGTANAYITFKAYPGHSPKIKASEGSFNAALVDGSYVIVDGLEFEGNNANLDSLGAYNEFLDFIARGKKDMKGRYQTSGMSIGLNATIVHHVIIRNCKIHDFPGGGVGGGKMDYVTIENNRVYNNSWYTVSGTSGISTLGTLNYDDSEGYKIIIRGNIVYNNKTLIPWASKNELSDGNGIIIDVNTAGDTRPAYVGRTLVENNVSYNNGGGGVHVFMAAHVDVVNNTAYHNGTIMGYPDIDGYLGSDVKIYNNIMYARNGGTCNNKSASATYANNIYFNGIVAGKGANDIVADPQFVKLALDGSADFRLKSTSPAINSGSNIAGQFSAKDILGVSRPQGTKPERGAYEYIEPVTTPEINIKQNTTSIADNTGTFSFGDVTFGTSKTITFTIENTGTGVLNLTGTPRVVVTGTGFSRIVDAPTTVSASGTATFQVRLQPNAAGAFSGTISIANNDANENPYNFAITGTGTKANQTITFNALPAKLVGNADFNAGATSSAGLAVAYSSSNTSVATIIGGLIHIVGAGTSVITASQAGNTNYNAATSVVQTLTVSLPLRTPENPANLISGLSYNYYQGVWSMLPDFNSLTPSKTGVVSTTDLTPRLREDDFAFSYNGYINIPTDGAYTFYTTSDDGSALYIGNERVVDNDSLHSALEASGTIGLKAGKHAITINFFDHLYSNTLTVSYAGPGITKVLIPASAYFTTTPTLTLEAEDASLFQSVVASGQPGNTGTGYVDYINPSTDYIEWTANTSGAGTYILKFRYALFSGIRNLQINVNGVTVNASLPFTPTGSWATWQTVSVTTALNAGVNKIRATANGTSGPNMDNLVVEKTGVGRLEVTAENGVNDNQLSAYPNPAIGELNVTFYSENESNASVELMTTMSQVVNRKSLRAVKGINTITLDVRGLDEGMYLLNVKSGSHKSYKKIIINK